MCLMRHKNTAFGRDCQKESFKKSYKMSGDRIKQCSRHSFLLWGYPTIILGLKSSCYGTILRILFTRAVMSAIVITPSLFISMVLIG